jgi:hypothetical protein
MVTTTTPSMTLLTHPSVVFLAGRTDELSCSEQLGLQAPIDGVRYSAQSQFQPDLKGKDMKNSDPRTGLQLGIRFKVLACLCFFVTACTDNGTGPTSDKRHYGLTGSVVNSNGEALDSVTVRCLYTEMSIPPNTVGKMRLNRISGVDTFAFRLYQNFPNPFSHSTFVRFSLPKAAAIGLSLIDRLDGLTKYTLMDSLSEGLYQVYLYRLVDSLQLRNGPYNCILEARAAGGVRYTASAEMFVISDSGAASFTTDKRGWYVFDYAQAFVGDSLKWTSDGTNVYTYYLTNTVLLLFQRRGFKSEVIYSTLFPNLLLSRDVVLIKAD